MKNANHSNGRSIEMLMLQIVSFARNVFQCIVPPVKAQNQEQKPHTK